MPCVLLDKIVHSRKHKEGRGWRVGLDGRGGVDGGADGGGSENTDISCVLIAIHSCLTSSEFLDTQLDEWEAFANGN